MRQENHLSLGTHFLGREKELKQLQEAWQRARGGDPQFLIVLAESGFGKTRLVQEFYSWLSRTFDEVDPGGYWPDTFVQVEDSMDVNPRFSPHRGEEAGAEPRPIPWLWWGLRFSKPGDRRNDSDACALERYVHFLNPHLIPILWARQRRALQAQVLRTAASTLTGLTPVGMLTALKDLHELWKAREQEKEGAERALKSVGALAVEHRQSLAELALDAFQTLLDPLRKEAQTVPVILVLDDAQWADRETLDFVEKLLARAHLRKWPLLVIATHWEREWHEHGGRALPDGTALRFLADLYHRQAARYGNRPPILLGKVPDLSPIVIEALPGLTEAQRRLILHRADGNPLLLLEIVRYLQRNAILFKERSVTNALTGAGETHVRRMAMDLHTLARDRFHALEDHIKDVIGWSSYQGVRFLRDITYAVAAVEGLQPRYARERVEKALTQADTPLALIRNALQSSLSEFRQVTFHEIARDYLALDVDNMERVCAAIRQVLLQWLRTGHLESLPAGERMDALQMAAQEFEAASDPDRNEEIVHAWAQVMAMLHASYRGSYAWTQALRTAHALLDAAPETGWPFEVIPLYVQGGALLDTLYEMRDLTRAFRLADQIAKRLRQDLKDTPESLRDMSTALNKVARVEFAQNNQAGALILYRESLAIRERLRDAFDVTPQNLRDVSISLDNVARVEFAQGHPASALTHYQESLAIRQRLRDEFGVTPQSLRDVSVSLENVAGIELAQSNQTSALIHYQESLKITERLRDEFGVTPQSLRDVSVSLDNVAGIEFAQGHEADALTHYQESLEIARHLRDEFGVTPQSLRDVSISLDNVARVEFAQNNPTGALTHYKESLALRRRLRDEFGVTPQSLRDVSISQENVARVELAQGNRTSALAHYQESLKIAERLRDAFGVTAQSLQDVAVSLDNVAGIEFDLDHPASALAHYQESLAIRQRLRDEFGVTPQSLRDIAVSLSSIAICLAETEKEEACRLAKAARELFAEIRTRYGNTAQAEQDVAWIHSVCEQVCPSVGG